MPEAHEFQPGNQFWKQRSRHGREAVFASPELLWDEACKYFEWVDSHPWYKSELVKSGDLAGSIYHIPVVRPYTLRGISIFFRCNTEYWRNFRNNHKDDEFSEVISLIENIIHTQKFEGAANGAFNANFIARDLGMADNTDIKSDGRALALGPQVYINMPTTLNISLPSNTDGELDEIQDAEVIKSLPPKDSA